MRGLLVLLESLSIKCPGFAAGLAFNQCGADGFKLGAAFLLAPDQIADIFTVVRVIPRVNLGFNPAILFVSQGDGFAYGCRD